MKNSFHECQKVKKKNKKRKNQFNLISLFLSGSNVKVKQFPLKLKFFAIYKNYSKNKEF